MDIFLSINNREQVIQLPIVPSEIEIPSPQKHEVFETLNLGDIALIGPKGLKQFSFSSFFPAQPYPFSRDTKYMGWEYVEMIEAWRERDLPMRIVITGTPINMAFIIDDFEYGTKHGSKDIYYTLSISEFAMLRFGLRGV
ncbi:hypothetical protein LGV96_09860 [Streptococcus mutans]|nr:hypothetical protein [Streptococcus mutans]MCB5031944.1 hypothetical protein [Streptococcus mutans]MCB5100717.1 hypothetical protein [Streptococcus mutans]